MSLRRSPRARPDHAASDKGPSVSAFRGSLRSLLRSASIDEWRDSGDPVEDVNKVTLGAETNSHRNFRQSQIALLHSFRPDVRPAIAPRDDYRNQGNARAPQGFASMYLPGARTSMQGLISFQSRSSLSAASCLPGRIVIVAVAGEFELAATLRDRKRKLYLRPGTSIPPHYSVPPLNSAASMRRRRILS